MPGPGGCWARASAPHPEIFPRQATRAFLSAPAPVAPHRGPRVAIVSDEPTGGGRHLRLHLAFTAETEALEVLVPPAAHVTAASVQARSFGPTPDGWLDLAYFGPHEDGLDLELTASDAPLALTVVAQTRGLPGTLVGPLGPRPPDLMPEVTSPLRASDMTLVAGSFESLSVNPDAIRSAAGAAARPARGTGPTGSDAR